MKYVLQGIETKRLRFDLVTENLFEAWLPFFRDTSVADFIGMDSSSSPKELCKLWFKKVIGRYENNLGGMNALIHKESGQLIGQCGLLVQDIDGEQRLEIGYSILPEYWGYGYATEAAIKCKEIAFERSYSNTIISIIHVDNIASEQVALKNGMSLEKKVNDFHGMPVNVFKVEK